jgi:hypothetical protein
MDGPAPEATSPSPGRTQLCDEIGRAVGALWQRRSGVRPTSVATEYVGDVVRCSISEGEAGDDAATDPELIGERRYENEAQAAVRRLTGRTVMGFTHRRAKDTGDVANAFILARQQVRN